MRITVVVPTYNEAENLPKLVSALFSLPLDLSLLIVDDNSPDGTGELAEKLSGENPGRIEVLHRPGKMGLRSAYLISTNLCKACSTKPEQSMPRPKVFHQARYARLSSDQGMIF